jgi:hypothetical protein
MRYTVIYEGTPLVPPVTLPVEATEEVTEPESTEQTAPPEPETAPQPVSEVPVTENGGMMPLLASGLAGVLLGAAAVMLTSRLRRIYRKWRESEDEA